VSIFTSSLQLRPATAADMAALVELEKQYFTPPWSENALQSTLDDAKSLLLVADVANVVVGYVAAWVIADEGEITRVVVQQQWRGRGIGETLLQAALRDCAGRGATALFLEVRRGNVTAQRLYTRLGFVEVGQRPRYYDDGEDGLILRLDLTTG
jgi:ribosomal-protein-alanine N-acetyltransferase